MASIPRAVCLLLVSLALLQSAVHCQITASDQEPTPVERIQAAFKEVTELSNNLRVETQKITFINAGTQGVKIGAGFSTIIVKITEYTVRVAGTSHGYNLTPLPDADAKLVVQSLTTFVEVHQALLNVVIGKYGISTLFPFFEPIHVSLVNLQIVIDTFAFYLIDLIPTQKAAADDQFGALSVTVKDAQSTYSNALQRASRMPRTDKPLVDVITEAFSKSTELTWVVRNITEKVTSFNAPLYGVKVFQGIANITGILQDLNSAVQAAFFKGQVLNDEDTAEVLSSIKPFAEAQQKLNFALIGKFAALMPNFQNDAFLGAPVTGAVEDSVGLTIVELLSEDGRKAFPRVWESMKASLVAVMNTYRPCIFKTALTTQPLESLINH